MFNKNLLIFFTLLLCISSNIAMAQNDTIIAIKPNMFKIDTSKKLILVNQPISEVNTAINNPLNSLTLDVDYTLLDSVDNLKIGTVYNVINSITSDEYQMYFTELPIISITTDSIINRNSKVLAHFTIVENNGTELSSNIGIAFRGASSQSYVKKPFKIEFWENEDGETTKNVSLLGMRSDDDWNLQAMYIEPLRLRTKTSFDIWRKINTLYYQNEEPNAINGVRMEYSELFINNEYRGLYCVGEKIDRKQLKLKKYKDGEVKGELYKGVSWDDAVIYRDCPPYDNSSELWSGFEYKYPDEIDVDWSRLYNHVYFIVNASDGDFYSQYQNRIHEENAIDYFIFLNLLRADDNTGKNLYVAKYKKDNPYFFVPWDLDAVFGITWSGAQDNSTSYLLSNKLFGKLLLNDDFKNKLSDRWSELRYNQIIDTDNLMDEFKGNFNYLNNNAVYEREMIAWQNYYTLDQTQLEYMENWISARIAYLDKTFNLKQIPVSIENDKNISEISIFPNPASDYLQIKANTQKQLNYNIYSLDGKYVKSDTFKGKTEIELSNINNGTYIIVLKGSNFHKTLKFSVTK